MSFTNFFDSIYKHSQKLKVEQFLQAMRSPLETQQQLLFSILKRNASSEFGKKYDFETIRSIEQYRNRVPIHHYSDLEPSIERMKNGERNILTSDPVVIFERTAGMTGIAKYIPYTKELFEEFYRATTVMLFDLFSRYPHFEKGKSYWAVGPKFAPHEVTEAGVSVGHEMGQDYLSRFERFFFKENYIFPEGVERCSLDDFRMRTVRCLIEEKELMFFCFFSPNFLIELVEYMDLHYQPIADSISAEARARFCLSPETLRVDLARLWPKLELISCWSEGPCAIYFEQLKTRFSKVAFMPMGLIGTEAVLSIPFQNSSASLLAINSHFYEFMDIEGKIAPLEHLIRGFCYSPLVTTSSGLYRYHTEDLVEVVGYERGVPLLRYIGRTRKKELCGENIDEEKISLLLEKMKTKFSINPKFQLVAPSLIPKPHYVLYLETMEYVEAQDIGQWMEAQLMEFHQYNMSRLIGQLGAIKVKLVRDGWKSYLSGMISKGVKSYGDIKPVVLSEYSDWDNLFNT